MNSKLYLVTEIKFETNRPKIELPIEYVENDYLAKIYLRTAAFNQLNISYKVEEWPHSHFKTLNTAEYNVKQPYDINVYDAATANFRKYPEKVLAKCILQYPDTLLLNIADNDIVDDIEQTVFEKLLYELPVDFIYTEQNIKCQPITANDIDLFVSNMHKQSNDNVTISIGSQTLNAYNNAQFMQDLETALNNFSNDIAD